MIDYKEKRTYVEAINIYLPLSLNYELALHEYVKDMHGKVGYLCDSLDPERVGLHRLPVALVVRGAGEAVVVVDEREGHVHLGGGVVRNESRGRCVLVRHGGTGKRGSKSLVMDGQKSQDSLKVASGLA